MTATVPGAPALGPAATGRRGRRVRRVRGGGLPYLLIVPAVLVLLVVVAQPLFKIVQLSLQKQESGKFALFHSGASTPFVGLANFRAVLSDSTFWTVLGRTAAFTAINVVLSLLLGIGIALLLNRVSRWARLLLVA